MGTGNSEAVCARPLLTQTPEGAKFPHPFLITKDKLEENPVLRFYPLWGIKCIKISYVQVACNRNIFKPTWLSVKIFRNQNIYSHNFKLKPKVINLPWYWSECKWCGLSSHSRPSFSCSWTSRCSSAGGRRCSRRQTSGHWWGTDLRPTDFACHKTSGRVLVFH